LISAMDCILTVHALSRPRRVTQSSKNIHLQIGFVVFGGNYTKYQDEIIQNTKMSPFHNQRESVRAKSFYKLIEKIEQTLV
jgi:hypothetical protein